MACYPLGFSRFKHAVTSKRGVQLLRIIQWPVIFSCLIEFSKQLVVSASAWC